MNTLYFGGTVVTMNRARTVIRDGAVAVSGDRIVGVGSSEELRSTHPSFALREVKDRLIAPGFLNLHTHSALTIVRGVCEDMGSFAAYTPGVPQGVLLSGDDCYALSQLGAIETLRHGTTLLADNYVHGDATARAFSDVGIRGLVSERIHDADFLSLREGCYRFDSAIGERTLSEGVSLVERWNSRRDGRVQAVLGPHAPDTCSAECLRQVSREAERLGVGLTIHLAQSRSEGEIIRAREGKSSAQYAADCGVLRPGTLAGHVIYVDDTDMALVRATGTAVTHHPVANAKYGEIAPAWQLRSLGVTVGLASDGLTSDMVEVMRFALCVGRIRGGAPTTPRAADVLAMATIDAARAIGRERDLGSIEIGKKADLVIMHFRRPHHVPNVDPVATLVHYGMGSDVETVIVDGQVLVDEGRITTVDEEQVISRAESVSRRLWERARA